MTKIKICGLTNINDVELINNNKVEYAGFVVFVPKSKRNNDLQNAGVLLKSLDKNITAVAVTISPDIGKAIAIEKAGFSFIQIHGEVPEGLYERTGLKVIKAFNVKDISSFDKFLENDRIVGFLFDARKPGSGKTFDWNILKEIKRPDNKLFILAGGLDKDNVKEAIDFVNPDMVDVSSGVENDNGIGKDPIKIKAFVSEVRG